MPPPWKLTQQLKEDDDTTKLSSKGQQEVSIGKGIWKQTETL